MRISFSPLSETLALFFIFDFCFFIGRTGNDTQTAADRFVYYEQCSGREIEFGGYEQTGEILELG